MSITLHNGTLTNDQAVICARLGDSLYWLPSSVTEWEYDDLCGYSADDVAPSPIKHAIIAERVRRDKERFMIEQGFTDADLGTTLFETLFSIWLDHQ